MRTHYTDPAPMSPEDDPEGRPLSAPSVPDHIAAKVNRRVALTALDAWESQIEADYAGTRMYDSNMADVKALRDQLMEV